MADPDCPGWALRSNEAATAGAAAGKTWAPMNAAAVTAAAPKAVTTDSRGLVQWRCHQRLALLAAAGFGAAGSGRAPAFGHHGIPDGGQGLDF